MSKPDNHAPSASPKKRRNSFWRRTRMVSFRVSDEEYERLKLQSQADGARSVSEFARLALVRPAPAPHGRALDAPVEQLRARVEQLGAQVSALWSVLEQARVENGWTRTEPSRGRREGA